MIDVDAVPLPAFGLAEDYPAFAGDWHHHDRHQLLFASRGTLDLETDAGRWLLPAQRAAWIGTGVRHRVDARAPVELRTVYFAPGVPHLPDHAVQVFAVTPLAREMILQATRWGLDVDDIGAPFLRSLGGLCATWCENVIPGLPRAQTPELQRAIDRVLASLDAPPSREAVAREVGLSARSLARRFAAETQTSWRDFVRTARMLRAMELLAADERVSDVALAVGYDSFSAFSQAFRAFAGESPSAYRASVSESRQ